MNYIDYISNQIPFMDTNEKMMYRNFSETEIDLSENSEKFLNESENNIFELKETIRKIESNRDKIYNVLKGVKHD